MSNEEILKYCELHNVSISFEFKPFSNACHIRMRRDCFQNNYILTPEEVQTLRIKKQNIVKMILDHMVEVLDKAEHNHDEESC